VKPPNQIGGCGFWIGSGVTNVLEVEELALEGDGLPSKSATNYFEGLVGSRSAFFERNTETFELFQLETDSDAELETPA
jgi:hypothetical protein